MRVYIPTTDKFGYKQCYGCDSLRTSITWHANRHIKEPRIILHYLCQSCYDAIIWHYKRYDKIRKDVAEKNEIVSCACGCGKQFPKYNQFGKEKKYYWASHVINDVKKTAFKEKVYVQCRCGCGQFTKHYPGRGKRISYYVNNHYQRTMKENDHNPINLNDPNIHSQRHNVLRLYSYLKKNGCAVNDALCKNAKHLYLMPLDGNHYNTDIENYVVLCDSHKLLKTFRKLTTMSEILAIKHTFYTEFKGGKRRWYQKASIPGIEMRKILSQEQGDFRRT